MKLLQLATGVWLQVGKNEQGERQVADLFERPVVCCGACGMCRKEWLNEVELNGQPEECCCEV